MKKNIADQMAREGMQRLRKQETYREKELQKEREKYAENPEKTLGAKGKDMQKIVEKS